MLFGKLYDIEDSAQAKIVLPEMCVGRQVIGSARDPERPVAMWKKDHECELVPMLSSAIGSLCTQKMKDFAPLKKQRTCICLPHEPNENARYTRQGVRATRCVNVGRCFAIDRKGEVR